MKPLFFILMIVALIAPSLAVLTDYQSGFEAGLKSGFTLGQSYQQMNDGKISVEQYNQVAASYNALIQSLFMGNQSALAALMIRPVSGVNPTYYPTSTYGKPVHAIDASWNQTNTIIGTTTGNMNQATLDQIAAQNGYSRDDTNGQKPMANARPRSEWDGYLGGV